MKLRQAEIGYITLVEKETQAHVKDCVASDSELIIVVDEGDMGLAIGHNGKHIEKLREKVGKKISVIEYSKDPQKFLKNLFAPAVLESVEITDGVAHIKSKETKRIIGSGGKRISRAKEFMERHFKIKDITVN